MAASAFRNHGSRTDRGLVALCMLSVMMKMGSFSLPRLYFLGKNVPSCCSLKRALVFGATFEVADHQYHFKLFCRLSSALKANAGVFLALRVLSYRDT